MRKGSEGMIYVKPSKEWANHVLADDIMTDSGTLLLAKGHVLTVEDIDSLVQRGINFIALEKVETKIDPEFTDLYKSCLTAVEDMFQAVSSEEKLEKETLFEIFDELMHKKLTVPHLFMQLQTIKDIDQYTFHHSLNVGTISALLAKLNGFKDDDIYRIGYAGFLHDIGKALIPQAVLQKSSALTEEEYQLIKSHPRKGYDILLKNGIDDEYILSAALMHHERLNGEGYPFGKKEGEIPVVAQIVAVADVYDAISADKVYKESLSPFHTYLELRQHAFRKELNAEIVVKFLEYISKLTEGKKVLLNNGSIGTVILTYSTEPNRPLIEVNGEFIDLRKNRDIYIKKLLINT